MRAVRASRSLSLMLTGSSSGGVDAQPASTASRLAGKANKMSLRMGELLRKLLQIHDLHPAILGPGGLVASGDGGPLGPVAHRGDLSVGRPLQEQRPAHRLRAPLAEADVVLARAALVRMAFEAHVDVRIGAQVFRVRRHDVGALTANIAVVEIEIDHA